MKKFLLSIAALGMAATAMAGTGTQSDPYTVEDIVAMGNDAKVSGVYVQGYIVGYINGVSYTDAVFGLPEADTNQTNIILGPTDYEDNIKYCLPVQLPAGDVRTNLNLYVNPDVFGHQVILFGDIEKYFGQIGIKNTKSYTWVGDAPTLGTGGNSGSFKKGTPEAPLTVTEYIEQGIPNPPVAGTYLTGYIVGYVNTDGGNNTWTFTASGCTIATNIVLAAAADVTDQDATVAVQLPAGDVRTALNLVDNPDNIGKQVTLYGTNEAYFTVIGLRSVTHYWWGATGEAVTDNPGGGNTGGNTGGGNTPSGVITVAQALEFINGGGTGTIQVKGYITNITTKADNFEKYHDMDYYIADEANGTPELYIYNGNYLNGAEFTSMDQIKVGDLVVVEGTGKLYNGTPELDRGSKIITLNGEGGSGETPSNPGTVNPGDFDGTVQAFDKGLGFPEGSAAAPKEETAYTATDTNITYDIMGCYVNSGYILLNGKNYEGAYISWTLPTPMATLLMTTSSGCSTNAASKVNVYANGNIIAEGLAVNTINTTYAVSIPEQYQAAGTVYKVESATTKYNQQFVSFKYSTTVDGVETVIAADDSEAVFFNLQGQPVRNPERGIFIKVVNGKAVKVVK